MEINVSVLDDDICKKCKKLKVVGKEKTNAYDETICTFACEHLEICKQLYKHIEEFDMLHKLSID